MSVLFYNLFLKKRVTVIMKNGIFIHHILHPPKYLTFPKRTLFYLSETDAKVKQKKGFLGRFKQKLELIELKSSGYILYEKTFDAIKIMKFLEDCELEDSFNSWFHVTELHIWLCMVRLQSEGEKGRYVRNCLIEALWEDVEKRAKLLGNISSSVRKKSIRDLSYQFTATLFSYDEGLYDDKILASAIWRILFNKDCKAEVLESVVEYVRKQIKHLDSQDGSLMITKAQITWLPYTL